MTKSRDEKADLAAEERSEDDGMMKHAWKAAEPAAWAAARGARRRRSAPMQDLN